MPDTNPSEELIDDPAKAAALVDSLTQPVSDVAVPSDPPPLPAAPAAETPPEPPALPDENAPGAVTEAKTPPAEPSAPALQDTALIPEPGPAPAVEPNNIGENPYVTIQRMRAKLAAYGEECLRAVQPEVEYLLSLCDPNE